MIQGREWGSLYLHLATLAFSVFAETHSTELSSWRFTLPTLLLPQTTHTQYYLSHGRRYKVESSSSSCCFCFHQPSPSQKLDNKVKNYTFIIDSLQTQLGISCSPNSLERRAKDFSFPILLLRLWQTLVCRGCLPKAICHLRSLEAELELQALSVLQR